jgi:hypothetical protein
MRLEMRQRLPQLIEKVGGTASIDRAGRHVPPEAQITHGTEPPCQERGTKQD